MMLGWGSPWLRAQPDLSIAIPNPGGPTELTLSGGSEGPWVAQDSYDGIHWRELGTFAQEGAPSTWRFQDPYWNTERQTPFRWFRAIQKSPQTLVESLNESRQRWRALNLTTYEFDYTDFGEFGFRRRVVSVKDGEVIEWNGDLNGETIGSFGGNHSIEDLFDLIESAIDQEAERIAVRYHPTQGYPQSIFIDYSFLIADEEISLTVGSERPPETHQASLDRHQTMWASEGPEDYRFHLRMIRSWGYWDGEVVVLDGEVSLARIEGSATDEEVELAVEDFFGLIEGAIQNGHELSVHYDPIMGYPTFISNNYRATFVDGPGVRYRLTNFAPISQP